MEHLRYHRGSLSYGWFCSAQTPVKESRATDLKHFRIMTEHAAVPVGHMHSDFESRQHNSTPCRTSTYRTVRLGTGVSRRCGVVNRATSTPASNPNK